MDNDNIRYSLGNFIHLKHYFYGVFATDNFPKLTGERFNIVNASPSQLAGSHWMFLFVSRKQNLFGKSAWNPHTKLPKIVLPSGTILE